ncbi:hypothetical protein GPX89_15665 [Nocardia sp. ET3-3]|uniref:Uncharacterized protein n=1 Tax=Nocardia terrae TaxID=2675851 RepID=A0A7K1UWS0_9NOCA|nr:hypothetical protein [Nocardia terrae]MVU78677.1 hypothetical protein [Nocardia terrae]
MTSPIRRGDARRVRETYTGPIVRCTHWRDQHEVDRLHVAVIGGGTALARVVPPVADQARRVTVFQHDPIWILPTPPLPGARILLRQLPTGLLGSLPGPAAPTLPGDRDAAAPDPSAGISDRAGGPHGGPIVPGAARPEFPAVLPFSRRGIGRPASSDGFGEAMVSAVSEVGIGILRWCGRLVLRQAAEANLRAQVGDSWQRRQLTPDRPAAVRVHGRYYRALARANCTLVSWPIARFAPLGIRTVDGVEHRVDCIIYAEDTL